MSSRSFVWTTHLIVKSTANEDQTTGLELGAAAPEDKYSHGDSKWSSLKPHQRRRMRNCTQMRLANVKTAPLHEVPYHFGSPAIRSGVKATKGVGFFASQNNEPIFQHEVFGWMDTYAPTVNVREDISAPKQLTSTWLTKSQNQVITHSFVSISSSTKIPSPSWPILVKLFWHVSNPQSSMVSAITTGA